MKNWKSTFVGIGMLVAVAAAIVQNPVGALTDKHTYEEIGGGVAFVLMREQGQSEKEKKNKLYSSSVASKNQGE